MVCLTINFPVIVNGFATAGIAERTMARVEIGARVGASETARASIRSSSRTLEAFLGRSQSTRKPNAEGTA